MREVLIVLTVVVPDPTPDGPALGDAVADLAGRELAGLPGSWIATSQLTLAAPAAPAAPTAADASPHAGPGAARSSNVDGPDDSDDQDTDESAESCDNDPGDGDHW